MRLVVGMSGASGVIYGVRFLQVLRELGVESHLILSPGVEETLKHEVNLTLSDVEKLATVRYSNRDMAAAPSSGSFLTEGMAVVPCSMKTLAGIVSGYSDNLVLRAADVTLKERRPLVLVPRETPLSVIHLENMLQASRAGAVMLPAMPGFYIRPKTIDDLVNHVVGKVLDALKIPHSVFQRWGSKETEGER